MAANPQRAARQAGLTYVNDDEPGITREPDGDDFAYRSPVGRRLRDARTFARIAALAIPPAYAEVWISPDPDGHIHATGRDARGRKQYRYHPRWRAHRDSAKFGHMAEFGRSPPPTRRCPIPRRSAPWQRALAVPRRCCVTPRQCAGRRISHPQVFTGWRAGALAGRCSGELDTDEAALLACLGRAA